MQEVRGQSAVIHNAENFFLHAVVIMLKVLVGNHAFANYICNRHLRIQRRIRILEYKLEIAPEQTHLAVNESRKVNTVITVLLIVCKLLIISILFAHSLYFFLDADNSFLYVFLLNIMKDYNSV